MNKDTRTTPQKSSPEQAMNEMMQSIDLLREVYIRETEALDNCDVPAFMEAQDEKLRRAGEYQQSIEVVLRRKDEIQSVDPALKQKLQAMQADFAALSKKNLEALERMQRSTQRLGDTIRSAAKESVQKKNTFNYGETGNLTPSDRRPISMGLSETA